MGRADTPQSPGVGPERVAQLKRMHEQGLLGAWCTDILLRSSSTVLAEMMVEALNEHDA